MEQSISNYGSKYSLSDGDNISLTSEKMRSAIEKSAWNCLIKGFRKKLCGELSVRHQKMIENYIDSELGTDEAHGDVLVNEIRNGRVSFAYEGLKAFPLHVVEVLRFDITHLDLSMNDLIDFDFLRGFHCLKSLIVDGNTKMEWETLPQIDTLELFYANKCEIEFPRSFAFRIAIIFPRLKYFSFMENPFFKGDTCDEAWAGRVHRIRMLVAFINPKLQHFNDRKITEQERAHAKKYHHYLGDDGELSKFKGSIDTDNLRKIVPFELDEFAEKALDILAYYNEREGREQEDDDDDESTDEGLADVKISAYLASQENEEVKMSEFIENRKRTRRLRKATV